MRYPGLVILEAYRSALNGQITYLGKEVPVFTRTIDIYEANVYPYIRLHDVQSAQDQTITDRDSSGHDTTILIEVYTRFEFSQMGSQKPMMQISDSVIQAVTPFKGLSLGAGYADHMLTSVDNAIPREEQDGKAIIYRNLIRMRNQIKEN